MKISRLINLLLTCGMSLSLLSCKTTEEPKKAPDKIKKAKVTLKPIKGSNVSGEITFTETPEGIRIIAEVEGLKQGKHGFHIHENGDCGDDGLAAGDHFNPTNAMHGSPETAERRHVGDLGNVVADDEGYAYYERVDKMITLNGERSIVGRAVIIHADEDDFKTQPSGNAGERVACGVIELIN